MNIKLDWEELDSSDGFYYRRAKVFGGWLVNCSADVMSPIYTGYTIPPYEYKQGYEWRISITFVPDPNHQWII